MCVCVCVWIFFPHIFHMWKLNVKVKYVIPGTQRNSKTWLFEEDWGGGSAEMGEGKGFWDQRSNHRWGKCRVSLFLNVAVFPEVLQIIFMTNWRLLSVYPVKTSTLSRFPTHTWMGDFTLDTRSACLSVRWVWKPFKEYIIDVMSFMTHL